VKRPLKRELKVLEIVKRAANKIGVTGIDPSRRKITRTVENFERFFDD